MGMRDDLLRAMKKGEVTLMVLEKARSHRMVL